MGMRTSGLAALSCRHVTERVGMVLPLLLSLLLVWGCCDGHSTGTWT